MISKNQYKVILLRVVSVLLVFITYFLFKKLYQIEISPSESYRGFIYNDLSIYQEIIILVFLSIPIAFLPLRLVRPSDFSVWIFYLIPYQSTIFMSLYVTRRDISSVVYLWMSLCVALFLVNLFRKHNRTISFRMKMSKTKHGNIIFLMFFSLLCLYLVYVIDFRFNMSFNDIYVRRMEAREVSPPMYRYIVAIVKSVFIVSGTYLLIFKKKILYFVLIVVASAAVFSFDGTKNSIINPCVLMIVSIFVLFCKDTYRLPLMIVACLLTIFFAIIEVLYMHSNMLSQIFVRRIFVVPGFLNTAYWDFFLNNPKTLMTESIGRFFLKPVYPVAPSYLIGIEYFNSEAINANTGIWLGAFSQFGLAGMMLVSCVAGFLLGLFDNLTKNNYFGLGCLVCAFIGLNWSEQMFHTSMLTGGVFYLFLWIMLVQKSRNLQQMFTEQTRRRLHGNG